MNFPDAIAICFQKYATFSGRATRSEYWFFILFTLIGTVVLGVIDNALFASVVNARKASDGLFTTIFQLVIMFPALAVAARRLHDTNKSGWWQLINFIPIVGWIIFVVWAATKGDEGPNRFDVPQIS